MNKERQAETEVQQSDAAELLPSAPLAAIPLLSAALSTEERKWYDRIKLHILSSKREYYCSWWLRLDYEDVEKDLSTTKINYWLTKLVKKRYLNKKTAKTHTQYSLTEIVA